MDIVNNKIRQEKLEKNTPELVEQLSDKLYGMLPRIKLSELLLEVSSWTKFDGYLTHASTKHSVKGYERSILMATLMATGTNIGLLKMAEAIPRISYHQMQMHEDETKRAQACFVNYQNKQQFPLCWGDGTTPSSDGMRIQIGVAALNSEFDPYYDSKKGATIIGGNPLSKYFSF